MTDRQYAIILLRDWLLGGMDPDFMGREEMSDNLDLLKTLSEKRHERIKDHVSKIKAPFEERVFNLYSNIKGVD